MSTLLSIIFCYFLQISFKMELSILFILFLTIFSNVFGQLDEITSLVQNEFMRSFRTPGVGITVVKDGDIILRRGFGLRDVENDKKVSENTLFLIGSVSKTIASTIAIKVLSENFPERGEAVLDTPIQKLAPKYNLTFSDRYRSESTSFRDLLGHRTCLNPSMFSIVTQTSPSVEDHIYRQRYAQEMCPFRSKMVYNNHMYDLAGDIIAHIAQRPYEDLVKDLFEDIGMEDSKIVKNDESYEKMGTLARGYHLDRDGQAQLSNIEMIKRVWISTPADGILSTAKDMTKFLNFQLNSGRNENKSQIIPEDVMKWMKKASISNTQTNLDFDKTSNSDFAYGLGLAIGMYKGKEVLSHRGYFPPYTSFMSIHPNSSLGIFTVSNGPGPVHHHTLHARIVDIVNGNEYEEKNAFEKSQNDHEDQHEYEYEYEEDDNFSDSFKNSNYQIEHTDKQFLEPKDLAGYYGNALEGEVTVYYDVEDVGKELQIEMGLWGTGYLKNEDKVGNRYRVEWDSDIVHDEMADGRSAEDLSYVEFLSKDKFSVKIGPHPVEFSRDVSLEDFKARPWDPQSCSP